MNTTEPPTRDVATRDQPGMQGERTARIALALFAAWYVGRPVLDPLHYVLLRDIILATHEAGHVLFMPFGEFLMVLGGTLLQVAVPVVFVAYFLRRRDRYAASIVALWAAFALTDAAHYIGDARSRQLPLLGGDPAGHDWTFLLVQTGMLERDRTIERVVRGLGLLVYAAGVGGALLSAWQTGRPRPHAAAPSSPAPAVTTARWSEP